MNLLKLMPVLKLRTRVILPVSTLSILSITFVSLYLINRQQESIRRELETSGETLIRIYAMQAEAGVIFESQYELDELLGQLDAFPDVEYAEIKNKDGTILSWYGQWQDEGIKIIKKINHEQTTRSNHDDFYIEDNHGNRHIQLQNPIFSKTEKVDREKLGITSGIDARITRNYITEEIGTIRLILSLEKVNELTLEAQTTAIILTILVLIVTIIILTLFVSALTKPLKILVDVTDEVSHGDLEQKVEINRMDEIGHLANTFNHMIESLKQQREEIEEYNRNLEEKIVERTLALEQAQSQLIQSEKMSAIGQLAAGVAHELNNPLGGILGYAQFALEKIKKHKDKDSEFPEINSFIRYLTDIEAQSRRCKNIVQNLLRFSRSTRTKDFEEIDINKVIEETRTFVEHQLHMKQIDLTVDLEHKLPLINGNAGQLQQVFTNMLINAMHASAPDTEVKIVTRSSPALGEFGGAVEILFCDQGCGIAAEDIKKIFEPFFTTKEIGKGTGLGLSVSYGIIKDHGGEIKVDSEINKGTTFTLILPVQKPFLPSDNQEKEFLKKINNNTAS